MADSDITLYNVIASQTLPEFKDKAWEDEWIQSGMWPLPIAVWDTERTWVYSKFSGFQLHPNTTSLIGSYIRLRSDGQHFYVHIPIPAKSSPEQIEACCENAILFIERFRTCSCISEPRSFCLWHNCEHKESAD